MRHLIPAPLSVVFRCLLVFGRAFYDVSCVSRDAAENRGTVHEGFFCYFVYHNLGYFTE